MTYWRHPNLASKILGEREFEKSLMWHSDCIFCTKIMGVGGGVGGEFTDGFILKRVIDKNVSGTSDLEFTMGFSHLL